MKTRNKDDTARLWRVACLFAAFCTLIGSAAQAKAQTNSSVWAWGGYNYYGQLGNGTNNDYNLPVQVKDPNGAGYLSNIVAIDAGGYHCLALKSDGTAWAWGRNDYGLLGDGTNIDRNLPVQVKEPDGVGYLTNVVAIAAGAFHSLALIFDQTSVTVSGAVTLEGNAQKVQSLVFGFRPVAGGAWFSLSLVLGADGTFHLDDIPRGRYIVRIKGSKWLAKSVVIDTRQGNVTDVNVLLLAGDANNDNFVDVMDLDALIAAFDSTPGDAHWNSGADLNCDDAVDTLDLDLLILNFDQAGD